MFDLLTHTTAPPFLPSPPPPPPPTPTPKARHGAPTVTSVETMKAIEHAKHVKKKKKGVNKYRIKTDKGYKQ